jgi:hypothetical protein
MNDYGTSGTPLHGGAHWSKNNNILYYLADFLLSKHVRNLMTSTHITVMSVHRRDSICFKHLGFTNLPVTAMASSRIQSYLSIEAQSHNHLH